MSVHGHPHAGGAAGAPTPGYPPASAPGHPAGPGPGYPTGPAPGYPAGQGHPTSGYPGGPVPGYPTGQTPGYPAGSAPGYPGGPAQRGYPGGPAQGHPTGAPPGYPSGPAPGYPSGPAPGHPSGSAPGYPSGPAPGYPSGPAPGYQPSTAGAPPPSQCLSKVELRIECKNLLDKDVMSKSDPCAVLYISQRGHWYEIGRTENVKNCLNPKFARCFEVDYLFEEVQKIRIAVYDIDNTTVQLDDDDFLGQVETTLGLVVSNASFTKPLLLRNGRKAGNGTITVRAEERGESKDICLMTFKANKLDKKDFLGKSDPYLEFSRACGDGTWQVVHRTEVVKNTLNPSWRSFELTSQTLCNNDRSKQIKIDCYDWDSDGSHDYIGGFTTTLEEMAQASSGREVSWPCVNPKKKAKKKSYQNSGTVCLTSIKITKAHSFLEFVMGGMQINFTIGIDFTASNGNPQQSTSLHYISPYQPNEYMQAIRAVGDVCQDYDTDKLFPALGFGARLPPYQQVSHEFPINFNQQNPYCQGIQGVLDAYANCIRNVQLYGPTNAAPIIEHVSRFAMAAQREEGTKGAHAYFILLLLTDGVLSDMANTRQAVVRASSLPMSLIIVGVGGADFSDMNMLDGDDGVLRGPTGEPVKRDIVQFVPFNEFKRAKDTAATAAELARHVLAEVPKQVTDYWRMRRLSPNTARPT